MQAHILGGQVEGKIALMFDDMISTAGSITGAAKTLHEHGVKEIHVGATHAVLCGPAIERLKAANLDSLVVTDSIPLRDDQILPQTQRADRRPAAGRGDQANPPQRIGQPAVSIGVWSRPIGKELDLGLNAGLPNGTMSGSPPVGTLRPWRLPIQEIRLSGPIAMAETLKVEKRKSFGKRNNERLRRAGRLPAVLYGHGEEAGEPHAGGRPDRGLAPPRRQGGRSERRAEGKALLQDVQWDTFFQQVLHVDLLRVRAGEKVKIEVPIELRGEAAGSREGGIIEQVVHSIEIEVRARRGSRQAAPQHQESEDRRSPDGKRHRRFARRSNDSLRRG